VLVPA
jgi:hypothetical protein